MVMNTRKNVYIQKWLYGGYKIEQYKFTWLNKLHLVNWQDNKKTLETKKLLSSG